MLANNLEEMYFSKSALKTYEMCQLKFKKRYLDGLYLSKQWMGEEADDSLQLGKLFHSLAESYYLRGKRLNPASLIDQESEELSKWLDNLIEFRSYNQRDRFLPEHEIRMNKEGIKVVAKYDLLYITPQGKAIIYDWKTTEKPPKSSYQRKDLQTIVYRYLLSKIGGRYSPKGVFKPEDITLLYWNPRFPRDFNPITYNQEAFENDEKILKAIINNIKAKEPGDFIATGEEKVCKYCEYRPICHGQKALELDMEEEDLDLEFDWDNVDAFEF